MGHFPAEFPVSCGYGAGGMPPTSRKGREKWGILIFGCAEEIKILLTAERLLIRLKRRSRRPGFPGYRPKNGSEPFDKLRAGSGAPGRTRNECRPSLGLGMRNAETLEAPSGGFQLTEATALLFQ
jgi:hypothetical protein